MTSLKSLQLFLSMTLDSGANASECLPAKRICQTEVRFQNSHLYYWDTLWSAWLRPSKDMRSASARRHAVCLALVRCMGEGRGVVGFVSFPLARSYSGVLVFGRYMQYGCVCFSRSPLINFCRFFFSSKADWLWTVLMLIKAFVFLSWNFILINIFGYNWVNWARLHRKGDTINWT